MKKNILSAIKIYFVPVDFEIYCFETTLSSWYAVIKKSRFQIRQIIQRIAKKRLTL